MNVRLYTVFYSKVPFNLGPLDLVETLPVDATGRWMSILPEGPDKQYLARALPAVLSATAVRRHCACSAEPIHSLILFDSILQILT